MTLTAAHATTERPVFAHDGLVFGCDYNPEQWDRETWVEDVALMREAGVDQVAVNIFGWAELEPTPGRFDFARLDEVLDLLHEGGIRVNLGTGTSSTPAWLTTRHPEVLPVAMDGTRRFPGGRQAWCPSSPVYRERSTALVEAVARRYGEHPAVELWHVSNELGCHNALCYCDESARAFRRWLEQRHGTIEALNRAWGTAFWSQRYGAWDEILPPLATLSSRNPGQVLDFHRFSSDALLEQYLAEADVIRRHSAVPVTTNFMVTAHIRNLDYRTWAPHMDVIANDHYLDHRLGDPTAELAFSADLTRGLAGGEPWLLMETSTGAVNWQPHNLAKGSGELTRNALTHVARGADGISFFQWRASAQGSEKFHSAMLPHAGADTDLFREVVELGGLMGRLGELAGTRVEADVALLFSWDSWWTHDGESRPSEQSTYLGQVHSAYAALRASGVTVDVVGPDADLSPYRLVFVPGLHSVSDRDAAALARWVEGGGHALITYYSGIVDETDRVRLGGYPGAYRELLGVRVEEFAPLAPAASVALESPDGTAGGSATTWAERMTVADAQVVLRFGDGPARGLPALTRRTAGRGVAWYLATAPEPATFRDVVIRAVEEAGATRHAGAGAEVEVVCRVGEAAAYRFIVNHSPAEVAVPANGHDLVTDAIVRGAVAVPAGGVRIVREDLA